VGHLEKKRATEVGNTALKVTLLWHFMATECPQRLLRKVDDILIRNVTDMNVNRMMKTMLCKLKLDKQISLNICLTYVTIAHFLC
jgi:hypothetical protein